MMNRFSMNLASAVVLSVFSGAAAASAFQVVKQNGSGLGNAYAGSAAVAENASTIYHNPGAMTRLQAREVSLGMAAIRPSLRFSDRGSDVGALAGSGNGGDAGGYWAPIPNANMVWALNKDVYLGLGISAPFGLKTDYADRWLGAAQSQLFDMKTLNVNPSIAWRVNEKVSLGFGLNWQKVDMKFRSLAGSAVGLDRIVATGELDDDAWGWNAGVLFELSPSTRLGISYRSRIKYHTTGDSSLRSDGSALGNMVLAGMAGSGVPTNAKIQSTMKLPDLFIVSVAQQLSDRWEMLGDISRTGWHVIPRFDIHDSASGALAQRLDANFRNAWRVALGATYKYNDQWKLKYGVAYDQSPVKRPETRLAQLPDNDRLWLSFGTQWMPDKESRVDLGMAYLHLKNNRINKDTPTGGHLSGNYKGNMWVLGAQYSKAF